MSNAEITLELVKLYIGYGNVHDLSIDKMENIYKKLYMLVLKSV